MVNLHTPLLRDRRLPWRRVAKGRTAASNKAQQQQQQEDTTDTSLHLDVHAEDTTQIQRYHGQSSPPFHAQGTRIYGI